MALGGALSLLSNWIPECLLYSWHLGRYRRSSAGWEYVERSGVHRTGGYLYYFLQEWNVSLLPCNARIFQLYKHCLSSFVTTKIGIFLFRYLVCKGVVKSSCFLLHRTFLYGSIIFRENRYSFKTKAAVVGNKLGTDRGSKFLGGVWLDPHSGHVPVSRILSPTLPRPEP